MAFNQCMTNQPDGNDPNLFDVTFGVVRAGLILPGPAPFADGILVSESNVVDSLPNGTEGQILSIELGVPAWIDPGDITKPEGLQYSDGTSIISITTGTINQVLVSDGVAPIWQDLDSTEIPDPLLVDNINERNLGAGVTINTNTIIQTLGMSTPSIAVDNGLVSAPTISFTGDVLTGLYYDDPNNTIFTTFAGVKNTGLSDSGVIFANNTYPSAISSKLNTYIDSGDQAFFWLDSQDLFNIMITGSLRIIKVGDTVTVRFQAGDSGVNSFTSADSYMVASFTIPAGFRPVQSTMFSAFPYFQAENSIRGGANVFILLFDQPTNQFYIQNAGQGNRGLGANGDTINFNAFDVTYLTS